MTHALLLAALVLGADHHAHHPKPPPPPPKAEPQPKPPEPEDVDPQDAPPPDDSQDDQTAQPPSPRDPDIDAWPGAGKKYSDPEYQAMGLGSLCCCLVVLVGFIALVVFIVRRLQGSNAKPATQPQQPFTPAPTAAIPFHLSVFALGVRAPARQLVAQQLLVTGVQADPTTAADRTQLVRELSKSLLGLEPEWSHFGYGERLDLADESSAARSYQLAVDDFTKRSNDGSLSGESAHAVMTLVLCTRRQLRGVSTLDDRAQIRALLQDRAALPETDLMGAFIVWSPPLGGAEVLTRFPEMHAIT